MDTTYIAIIVLAFIDILLIVILFLIEKADSYRIKKRG
jgi:hypothetical protein